MHALQNKQQTLQKRIIYFQLLSVKITWQNVEYIWKLSMIKRNVCSVSPGTHIYDQISFLKPCYTCMFVHLPGISVCFLQAPLVRDDTYKIATWFKWTCTLALMIKLMCTLLSEHCWFVFNNTCSLYKL